MLSLGCMASEQSHALEIYRYVDLNGQIHFTDKPKHDGYQLIQKNAKASQTSRINIRAKEANRKRFSPKISEVAKRHQVPEALIHAVISIESAYDPNAVSRAGAVGLMQLMPATARRYGVADRRDPLANLNGGTKYLKDLLDRFDRQLNLVLAGYNAGESAVEKYGNQVPPFEETQKYVRKVLKLYVENSISSSGDI